jgi:hypothetical protein
VNERNEQVSTSEAIAQRGAIVREAGSIGGTPEDFTVGDFDEFVV